MFDRSCISFFNIDIGVEHLVLKNLRYFAGIIEANLDQSQFILPLYTSARLPWV